MAVAQFSKAALSDDFCCVLKNDIFDTTI